MLFRSLRECGRRDWRLAGLSSALAFPLDLRARPLCRRHRGRGCGNCQNLPQAELFVRQREGPGLHRRQVLYPLNHLGSQCKSINSSALSLLHSPTLTMLKFMSIESVMPFNHLILCHPLLLLPPIFPASKHSEEMRLERHPTLSLFPRHPPT